MLNEARQRSIKNKRDHISTMQGHHHTHQPTTTTTNNHHNQQPPTNNQQPHTQQPPRAKLASRQQMTPWHLGALEVGALEVATEPFHTVHAQTGDAARVFPCYFVHGSAPEHAFRVFGKGAGVLTAL